MSAVKNMTPCPAQECAPCPGCGHAHDLMPVMHACHWSSGSFASRWHVVCPHCRARGPAGDVRAQAVEAWNRVSALCDAAERVALAGELFARYAMGPEAVAMLRHGVPLAAHPIVSPVDPATLRAALAALDHCVAVARGALGR